MKIRPNKAGCKSGNKASHSKASYATQASTTASKVRPESSGAGASPAPKRTTAAAIAPIAAEQVSNTETAKMSAEIRPSAGIPRPEESDKPVATYEFIWHYDHDPVFVPREITQSYWQSDSKELVQFYNMRKSLAQSSDDTHIPTHRAEVRIFRNNEKRVTFKSHFPESYKVLKDVRFIKAESIHMDGSRWPVFEDSRRLEDLDLRLRDERDKNGYCYIEFFVRQISHRDSGDMMPHLAVLGRRVVGTGEVFEFSKEEGLRLVRRRTSEPCESEEIGEVDDVTGIDETMDDHGFDDSDGDGDGDGDGDVTDVEEGSELEDVEELRALFSALR